MHEHTQPSDSLQQKRYRKEEHEITKNKGWKGSKDVLHVLASSKTSLIKALFLNYLSTAVASTMGENQGPICMSPMQVLKAVWKRSTVY